MAEPAAGARPRPHRNFQTRPAHRPVSHGGGDEAGGLNLASAKAWAFDSVAPTYDAVFGSAPAGRLFRFRLAERVMETAGPRGTVLDIGCGTGEDALWLAGQGFSVHGIDASPKMIAEAERKGIRAGSRAAFECKAIEEFAATDQRFDAIVSNFGALNCVPLEVWTDAVPRLMNPSGRAFVVLMGSRPLPERLRGGGEVPARTSGAEVRVGVGEVRVHYEPVSAVVKALSISAVVERVEALGCLVPGPGYARFAQQHPIAMGIFAAAEAVVREAPFFRDRGDHTLFEFRPR